MGNLKVLITKLSPPTRAALEKSANYCINQLNYEIEIEHLFVELLQQNPANDLLILLRKNNISFEALINDLKESINALPKGNTRTPIFTKSIVRLFEQAWLLASAEQNPIIRSSHLFIALLTAPDLQQIAFRASSLFELFPIDTMKHKFLDICGKSSEQPATENYVTSVLTSNQTPAVATTTVKTPALDQYTINLTEKAKNGQIDPVIGREFEIRLMLDILMRRRQNNPILTGEPGVGKTAVVEGLALKISQGLVPEALRNVQLHVLDMGLLQAGASVKGEFENRLKQVIQEVQASAHPIILFIDEAHTLIGAGGQAGQNDAANLLKPALARGELRTIAATTWAEYKQYFEKDAALSRRFQVVKVEEPTEEVAIDMLRAMIPVMQNHFKLHIDDQAIITAIHASHRYISGRQLPDKAISVLDTAAARVALTQNAQPVVLDQLKAQQHNLKLEQQLLSHEHQQFPIHHQRLEEINQQLAALEKEIQDIETRWQQELALVQQIQQLGSETEQDHQAKIASLRADLAQLQGQAPLVFERVNAQIINEIISDWTGIPVGNMVNDEIRQILSLENKLAERVMGQDYALSQLVQGIKTSKARLEDPNKPQGVFLLVGPSGVGKTETALALANELYGGEQHLITINMSEYQEAHTVSSLKGAPPGYVGYGQGGVLTEAVRRNPYSVVLLDEIEKAHSDVQELFYQVFDKGMLEDGEGRLIDFKNTTILLTSNTGSSAIMQACLNQPVEQWPSAEDLIEQLKPSLYKQFKPAFIGRMRIVPYLPLHDDLLVQIIQHKLGKIVARIKKQYATQVEYSEDLIELLLNRCTEVDSGARNVDNILNSSVLPSLATEILIALAEHKLPKRIMIDTQDDEITYQLDPAEKAGKKRSGKKAKAEV
ncbi:MULTISPECIES: type VI secretion system ATPase TssH [unclassified Acinetobacter]|uniref:type VI secretion system ATPase TssH n=1 Tax=unclassified Acinetobacter TaxID=196816 RepID=UPI00244C25BC|nr:MULTISPECIES: type VI secretion system ATPase TssH [unclassified Acinetobacter]MDH0032149.1 type VI secretion system ATPase TssH [Acinetobacter sp. GD04021]MDH0887834.1 type VI secretion system ATPase TssH [Acinetobacter sp. GD03873]MDH1081892.1 type VI secretion system ATPase TssH [Acinetobacter sp. GD03983]MDH2191150.1 type VI secretion system ATPase TssH [Acinetobacter sp. GD03645]MDH2204665.1 type VI secretion system ATPase TssH [Acinetobacter sp. GD03647]